MSTRDATETPADQDPSVLDRLAQHRTGLAAISFAESTVVPIPLETIVAPLMVGHPKHAVTIAIAIWLGCLAGALVFYGFGAWLAEPVVRPALSMLGLEDNFTNMIDRLGTEGLFWTVFLVSFSPAPMQIVTLGAGAAKANVLSFLVAIALSRGLRYFGLAILAQIIGPRITELGVPKRILIPGMILLLAVIWGIMQLV
ncbi:YqaA family protein [Marivita sp. S0852]|uniref:YqaA family protein n=1 Tax=Marivita sp. S0852 TaxID=3373893 RepID=UPI003981E2FD